jgi:hypothetical protein
MSARTALLALAIPAALAAQTPSPAPPAVRAAAWREDLAIFAKQFPASQFEFDKLYPRARFDEAMRALTSDIDSATDAELVLGLMRFVATAHVGHTYVRLPTTGPMAFHRLPIGLQWFSDGLAVTSATDPYREALGLRVTRFGNMSPELLESAVATYISYERDAWLHLESQRYMLTTEVLRALGQEDADGTVAVTVARPDGSTLTLHVSSIGWADRPNTTYVTTARNLAPTLAQKEPARYYRYEILPESKTLYVRYSRCQDDPVQPFAAFAQELFAKVEENPNAVDRVVVDLRANGGGNSAVIKPLVDGLRARKALSARGHLYALTGPATFSSGLLAAWSLKNIHAILVGEASGENLNTYSEVRELTLPHSQLVVQYATKFNRLGKDGQGLEPDVKVTKSIGDLLNGKDPVLEEAIRHK